MSDSHKIVLLPLYWPKGGLVNLEKGDTFGKEILSVGRTAVIREQQDHSALQSLQKGHIRDLNKSGFLQLIRILLRLDR